MRRGLLLRIALLACAVAVVALLGARHLRHTDEAAAEVRMLDALPTSYDSAGRYVGPIHDNINPPLIKLSHGVPIVEYAAGVYHENPVTVAQYGLWAFSSGNVRIALREANWLIRKQQRDGRWLYRFDFDFPGAHIASPWPSAMAQGQAMSLFERVYRRTKDLRYLKAAIQALQPLQISVKDGGVRRCLDSGCAFPFFEEYPTRRPSMVLNGFMFTLIGLHDLATIAPHSQAEQMFSRGCATLSRLLPRYDRGGSATYDLASSEIANIGYQAIHVYLLRVLNELNPHAAYRKYASIWMRSLRAS